MEQTFDNANPQNPSLNAAFTGYQKFVIAVLSFLQFTIILDFMIMSPLGAVMMPALSMTTSQFGLVVSAYAFSAGASGLLAAGFADRFDRKKLLMFFYAGFVLGTLLCALATSFEFLLVARMVTGIFGGVIGSVAMAIMTDLFPMHQRGRVIGFMQSSFAASQVLGIPLGLYITNLWGWHMPFIGIVVMSLIAGVVILVKLKPIDGHLGLHPDRNALHHLWLTLKNPQYALAFVTVGLMSIGGFMLMPFGSAFTVNNLGIAMDKLPTIYLITGVFTIFIGPLVGKATDTFGKMKVFTTGALLSITTVVIYTNLGVTPLWAVILINVVMFCAIFSRMIPSQALMSAIPIPENRGAFMAVSSSLQQIAGGLASVVAGLIVYQSSTGQIQRFDVLGYILVCTVLLSVWLMFKISRRVGN